MQIFLKQPDGVQNDLYVYLASNCELHGNTV